MLERLRAGKSSMNGVEKSDEADKAAMVRGASRREKAKNAQLGAEQNRQEQAKDRAETAEERGERFQRKLVKYFSVREKDIDLDPQQTDADPAKWLEMRDEIVDNKRREALASFDAEVDEQMRQRVLDDLAIDKIGEEEIKECLLRVRDPIHSRIGSEGMFAKIEESPFQMQILAVAAGGGMADWQTADEVTMRDLLKKKPAEGELDFRTPIGYETFKRKFLRSIDKRATEEQKRIYTEAANDLEETLYGRRLEYYRQFQELRHEAEAQFGRKIDAQTAQVVANTPDETREKLGFVALRESLGEREYEAKRDSLLGKVLIDGSPWDVNGREHRLNVQHLEKAGLAPEYETRVDKQEIYLSKIFQLDSGRPAVISYVPTEEGEVVVNSYYRSLSTGVWRMLPDYIRRPNSLQISAYGYGYGMESLVLPVQLQQSLARLETKSGVQRLEARNADFLFAGMTRGYGSFQEYADRLEARQMRGNYYEEVASEPYNHDFQMISSEKRPPYTQSVNIQTAPDFHNLVAKYSTTTLFAGPTTVKCFQSNNGEYLYAFNRDGQGRAWIGQIEDLASPVTSTGLRREWVDGGDLLTGLYEPSRTAGKYGDPRDMRGANLCMWRRYLSQMPLIREFIESQR